jgi:hypothetical protein
MEYVTPWNRGLEKLIVAELAKIFQTLCITEVHYRVHKNPPPVAKSPSHAEVNLLQNVVT